jgi:hypothetical protein
VRRFRSYGSRISETSPSKNALITVVVVEILIGLWIPSHLVASLSELGRYRNDPNQDRLILQVLGGSRRLAGLPAVPNPSACRRRGARSRQSGADRRWFPSRSVRRCSTGSMARRDVVGLVRGGRGLSNARRFQTPERSRGPKSGRYHVAHTRTTSLLRLRQRLCALFHLFWTRDRKPGPVRVQALVMDVRGCRRTLKISYS